MAIVFHQVTELYHFTGLDTRRRRNLPIVRNEPRRKMFFYKWLLAGGTTMIDPNTRSSDSEPDGSWVWVGGALAAVFLLLGLFAIFWGGNMPATSAKLSPTATSSPATIHAPTAPQPTTTGQRAR
jgi:hypothetical protein